MKTSNNLLKFCCTLFAGLTVACSSDDNQPVDEEQTVIETPVTEVPAEEEPTLEEHVTMPNGFTFNGQFYAMNFLYVNDENGSDNPASGDIGIILADKDILNLENSPEVDFVYLDVNDVALQQTTYQNFSDYDVYVDSPFVNGQIQPATTLFDDNNEALKATASSVTISSITNTQITITFLLTRADGHVLTGYYNGAYSNISN